MNGALFSSSTVDAIGVPDLRLFFRGDEVEMHRRLARSGIAFGTCLTTAYVHPDGSDEFRPILGGRMHTQYPDNEVKRFFTYRNRGYLMSQPGMRKLLPRSTPDSAGTSWCSSVTSQASASGCGCARWVARSTSNDRRGFASDSGPILASFLERVLVCDPCDSPSPKR